MSNYSKTVDFAVKDALSSGNAQKLIKGSEIDLEYDNIAIAIATKAELASPTFTGTVTAAALIVTGLLTAGTIDGGTY